LPAATDIFTQFHFFIAVNIEQHLEKKIVFFIKPFPSKLVLESILSNFDFFAFQIFVVKLE
jgi:hypothetical protein